MPLPRGSPAGDAVDGAGIAAAVGADEVAVGIATVNRSFLPRNFEGRVDWTLVAAYAFEAVCAVLIALATAKGWLS